MSRSKSLAKNFEEQMDEELLLR